MKCPVGYYCEAGSINPTPCPSGTFRPNMGAAAPGPSKFIAIEAGGGAKTCFNCTGGYYCPTKHTVVPELCPAGSYCPDGSIYPVKCEPGKYCPAGVDEGILCPAGFYCRGSSDIYLKCGFGTYCELGSS
jgi:hypothetical protein